MVGHTHVKKPTRFGIRGTDNPALDMVVRSCEAIRTDVHWSPTMEELMQLDKVTYNDSQHDLKCNGIA
ncbi:hypothetical protein Plhal304r1_c004g0015721 [Plasmopara halstedii]